jgi:hypothetical protein
MLERNGRGEKFSHLFINGRRMLRLKKGRWPSNVAGEKMFFFFGYCVHIRVVLELSIIYQAVIYKSTSFGLEHIGRS